MDGGSEVDGHPPDVGHDPGKGLGGDTLTGFLHLLGLETLGRGGGVDLGDLEPGEVKLTTELIQSSGGFS